MKIKKLEFYQMRIILKNFYFIKYRFKKYIKFVIKLLYFNSQ